MENLFSLIGVDSLLKYNYSAIIVIKASDVYGSQLKYSHSSNLINSPVANYILLNLEIINWFVIFTNNRFFF